MRLLNDLGCNARKLVQYILHFLVAYYSRLWHVCQDAHNSLIRARAALKYIVLALSGHMDDILGKYKVLN